MKHHAILAVLMVCSCGETTSTDAGPTDTPPDVGDTTDTPEPPGDADLDGDGFAGEDDCDDTDAARFPGALERCNGIDDDCDGEAPGEVGLACAACDDVGLWVQLQLESREDAFFEHVDQLSACADAYSQVTTWMFTQLDKQNGEVEGVYTGVRVPVGDEKPDPSIMNTEHTWPQSLGGGDGTARCDLHHLFPTDSLANSERANLPLGEAFGNPDWAVGGSVHDAEVFEPRDAQKGPAARALLYMDLRYSHLSLEPEYRARMEAWDAQYPPSDQEVARTMGIWGYQGTANPYIICR